MNDINIMKKDIFQTLVKYQLSSFSQKLISPTDPSQFTLTYAVLRQRAEIYIDILV